MKVGESDATNSTNGKWQFPLWQAVLFLLLAVLLLGGFFAEVAAWSPLRTEAAAAAPSEAPPAAAGTSFEYFPDKYLNQATRIEDQPPTF